MQTALLSIIPSMLHRWLVVALLVIATPVFAASPTILVDTSGSSDTAASGAGPATALTGTAASTDVGGTTVTLDGSPDLTGVATDGSHVIYIADATAGHRNFSAISGSDNSAKTVTVSTAFTGSLSGQTWAIGSKRATIGGTNSKKLLDNNGAAGDAMPGWTIQLASGYTETLSANLVMRRAGDTTTGRITLQGTSGGTRPILTFSNNGAALTLNAARQQAKFLDLRNSNATKTASVGVTVNAAASTVLDVRVAEATTTCSSNNCKFWKGILVGGSAEGLIVQGCEIGNAANLGMDNGSTSGTLLNNYIYSSGSHGANFTSSSPTKLVVIGNIFAYNATDGLNISSTATTAGRTIPFIIQNTFHGNGGDGVEISAASTNVSLYDGTPIMNNVFSYNSGYGLNFSGSSVTDAFLGMTGTIIAGNDHYTNSLGFSNLTLTVDRYTSNVDPAAGLSSATKDYADATGGSNFQVAVGLKALGYPKAGSLTIGNGSTTSSYVDPGAAQRQEPTASGVTGIMVSF